MVSKNPEFERHVVRLFNDAAFVGDIGIELVGCGPGWCEARLNLKPRHLQHGGVVHAGVQATLADHTAGAAATTLLAPDEFVLTIEFKISLLRPALGEALQCRAEVLKPGTTVSVVEAEVFAISQGKRVLTGKFSGTMAVRKEKT
jgi:uncharacterized protein (TIGR00369 family)